MDELIQAVTAISKQIKETEDKLSSKIDSIDEKLCNFKSQLDDLKESHERQEKRLDSMEKDIRIRNIVFFGIPEQEKSYFELEDILIKTITYDLQVECQKSEIQQARRIGKKGDRPRPIILGLTTYGKKVQILKNKNKLIDTGFYIKEDYSPKVLQERKGLQEQLRAETEKGKKVFIKYNKSVVIEDTNTTPKTTSENRNKKRTLPSETSPNSNNSESSRATKKNKTRMENKNITQYLQLRNRKHSQNIDQEDVGK